jgi:hypothetical protein
MELIFSGLVGAALGVVVTGLLHPLAERLERFSRRLWRSRPLLVHIEADRRLIWAGSPPWVAAAVWVPRLPQEQPPEDANDWSAWAGRLGGHDADVTMLQVTLQAKSAVSVVVDRPAVRHSREELTDGAILLCPVGGADLLPRRIELDLDTFAGDSTLSRFLDYDEEAPLPALQLAGGDVERFQIWATATSGYHQWQLELPLLVDGRRERFVVNNGGDAFRLVGIEGLPTYAWDRGQWSPMEMA